MLSDVQSRHGGMRVGYLGFPDTSGPYSLFQVLRPALRQLDIELRWFGTISDPHREYDRDEWKDENQYGEYVGKESDNEQTLAKKLVEYLNSIKFEAILVNVLSTRLPLNVCRYISNRTARVMVVHSTSRGTYLAANAFRDFVEATVCVSPRIKEDLIRKYAFTSEALFQIPNAYQHHYDTAPSTEGKRLGNRPIRILSLGRIDDSSKGVLWIPEILKSIDPTKYHLTIAGDGPDLQALRSLCHRSGISVTFTGTVNVKKACQLYDEHDLFLFPSRFEGFGIALVESMRRGCVPIASAIRGVTNDILGGETCGFLFPAGDIARAKRIIQQVIANRSILETKKSCSIARAKQYYSPSVVASAYAEVLRSVLSAPRKSKTLEIDRWSYPLALRRGLRSFVPNTVKRYLRTLLSR